jgi:hypothetical protein
LKKEDKKEKQQHGKNFVAVLDSLAETVLVRGEGGAEGAVVVFEEAQRVV